jgi:short-subunit dehydrogenase
VSRAEGQGRTALVTGASAGIGAELARVFAAEGFDIVLTARRADRLAALADELRSRYGVQVRTMPADLALPETPAALIAALEGDGVTVDALINNAGFAVPGRYRDTPWEAQRDFLQVLMTAPCELIQRVLPGMTNRGYGRILNVASVAGLMPGAASHTLYGGAKAMLIKISQSLHSEQKGTGVHVTALCPGFTYTEFHDVTGTREEMRRMPRMMWLSADRVAREGYKAVMKNRAVCIPGAQYKAITTLARLLPLGAGHHVAQLRSRILAKRK